MTKITAHRGWKEIYPENTLLALTKAVEQGAERVEFDLHMSQDGELIVHHDYSLGNPDNGNGLIVESSSVYIRTLDAGRWFAPEFAGERIPLLDEVIRALGSKVEYEIELKGFGLEFIKKVLRIIKAADIFTKVEFTSSSVPTLMTVKHLEPLARTGMFVPVPQKWMSLHLAQVLCLNELTLAHVNVAHCPLIILDENFVRRLHEVNILVHAADCDSVEELKTAYGLGVDQISTSKLELAQKVRES